MSLYHVHCDIIGRSGGRSATAAAAYRSTSAIEDRTTGETFDFTRKEKAVFSEILTNGNAPEWATDRAELWNRVEEKENRKNSQFCRSFDIALMKEFDTATNIRLVEEWARTNYVSRDLIADIAIHEPHKDKDGKSNDNTHAHILITTRKIDRNGWTEKDRDANEKTFLQDVRKSWADIVNAEYERRGMSERIDERTLKEQGKDREPQKHMGAKATAMNRKGKPTDRTKYEQEPVATVTDEELKTALKQEVEWLKLNSLLNNAKMQKTAPVVDELKKWENRIRAMTPKQWEDFMRYSDEPLHRYVESAYGEYVQTINRADRTARELWIEQNIAPVTREFQEQYQAKKTALEEYLQTEPTPIAERPNAFKAILYEYHTDEGERFSGVHFDDYRVRQQAIIDRWERNKQRPESDYKTARHELQACYDKDFKAIRQAIEEHHPTLAERMAEGALELMKKLEQFLPVRAMVRAVKKLRDNKNRELAEHLEIVRQTQKNRSKSRDNGRSR